MLPSAATPRTHESLGGYLWRVVRSSRIPMTEVVAQLYPAARRRRNVLGFAFVPPSVTAAFARQLDTTPAQVRAMTLQRFGAFRDGVDQASIRGNRDALTHQRAHWWQFRADRYCPDCLCEDGTWRVSWLSPWAFACTEHRRLLRDECSECGAVTRLITNAHDGATDERCSCGALWRAAVAEAVSDIDVVVQARLTTLVEDDWATLWGDPVPSAVALDVWRAGAALTAGAVGIRRWAARPWLTPPRPSDARAVFVVAGVIAEASDVGAAAYELRELIDEGDAFITNRVRDRIPATSALQPAIESWQTSRTRVATRLDHRYRQAGLDVFGLRESPLPTVAPLQALPDGWRADGPPHILLRRAAVSLAAARLGGAGSWAEAGARVGITARYAPRVSRYVLAGMGASAAVDLGRAATNLAAHVGRSAEIAAPPIDSFAALLSFVLSTEAQHPRGSAAPKPEVIERA
ncbi:TniQ family protein [Cellulomonas endometrii]|uniref:TniQ family protein n=1 Tax=Cellulomonas endometrii TaxID=3036301 RepID=UPI0024AC9191|nr:TniQ family protein [Cellulomonas endometrii]